LHSRFRHEVGAALVDGDSVDQVLVALGRGRASVDAGQQLGAVSNSRTTVILHLLGASSRRLASGARVG
jgi:hypothetical protein